MARHSLTVLEAQQKLNARYPDNIVQVIDFLGVNKPCTVSFNGFELYFSQFNSLMRYDNTRELHNTLTRQATRAKRQATSDNPTLTSDEQQLIDLFRGLTLSQQRAFTHLLGTITTAQTPNK